MRDAHLVKETAANKALQSRANHHAQNDDRGSEFLGDQNPTLVRNSMISPIHPAFNPSTFRRAKSKFLAQTTNRQTHHASQIRNYH
jgi:hypothetical protein